MALLNSERASILKDTPSTQTGSTAFPVGEGPGDPDNPRSIPELKEKITARRGVKPGTKRGAYNKTSASGGVPGSVPKMANDPVGPSFDEAQVKALLKGCFSMAALSTNCNAWILEDAEAESLAPSGTVTLNSFFPQVAASKWTALTLFSLSLMGISLRKYLLWRAYVSSLRKPPVETVETPAPNL